MAVLEPNEMFYTEFEPKVNNRFYFYIDGIPAYLIKGANRPSYSFNTLELPHINITRKVKGKVSYNNISLTLYNPISPSGSQIVMEWVRLHHESVTGRDGYADLYKKDVTFNTLDPVGAKIEEWTLKGAFIVSSDFGAVSWDDDGITEISLELAYDYPILQY